MAENEPEAGQIHPPRSLRLNSLWSMAGMGIYGLCQMGIIVLVNQLFKEQGPVEAERYVLGLAIATPVLMFTNLHMRTIQATDAAGDYKFADYLGLRLVGAGTAFAVIVGIVAVIAGSVGSETALVILAVGAAKSAESVSTLIYGLYQKYERMDRVAIGLILRGTGGLVVLAVTMWLTRQTLWGFAAMAAWWVAVLIFYDVSMGTRTLHRYAGPGEKFRPAWHGKTMRRLAWLALPMGIVMVFNSLNVEIPRYFLKVFHEEGTLGRFASIAVFLMAGQMIAGALGQTASPRLAKYFLSDRSAYVRLVLKLMAIGAAVGVAGILAAVFLGKFALQILNKEYVQYNWLLTWFMIYGLVLYTGQFLSVAVTASRRFRSQSVIQAGICGLLAFLCLVLVPSHGMIGAVISMMIAMALGYAAYLVVMVRAVRQGPISSA